MKCTAHKTDGTPCRAWAIKGANVCRVHGGSLKRVKAAAARRLEEEKQARALRRGLAQAYGEDVPTVDPGEAMLQAVSWKHAEVVALRLKVSELEDRERIWGVTREKRGGEDYGTTEEAKPHAWWVMLRSAEEQLVKFAAAARAAGCDERRVALAEQQGDMIAAVLRVALDGIATRLDLAGTPSWVDAVAVEVPAALRTIGSTDGSHT